MELIPIAIVGGETHPGEVTRHVGKRVTIVATCMDAEHRQRLLAGIDAPNFPDEDSMLAATKPSVVAIANENDRKFASVMKALRAGSDVIVDKPLCLTMSEQQQIEAYLRDHRSQRLLNLLTLRGNPVVWRGLRDLVQGGMIGVPAFVHIRMAVQLKRSQRLPWFLDFRRSGGLFLDLLIHGLDQVEWMTGKKIVAVTANMGNLGYPEDEFLWNHAAAYCELEGGGSAVVEGQRMLPDTKGSDYRASVAGTKGFADLSHEAGKLTVTSPQGAEQVVADLPAPVSVVEDWLDGGELVGQTASLRANYLAIQATISSQEHQRIQV